MNSTDQIISERYFNGLPVIDATESIRIWVSQQDINSAVPHDPTHCVFAEACKRIYSSTAVVFLRSVAYVDMPDENNNRVVYRFYLNNDTGNRIREYDKTKQASPGSFVLSAPRPSRTLAGLKEQQKRHLQSAEARERRNKLARAAAKRRKENPPPKYVKTAVKPAMVLGERRGIASQVAVVDDIRFGSGMVHFIDRPHPGKQ